MFEEEESVQEQIRGILRISYYAREILRYLNHNRLTFSDVRQVLEHASSWLDDEYTDKYLETENKHYESTGEWVDPVARVVYIKGIDKELIPLVDTHKGDKWFTTHS